MIDSEVSERIKYGYDENDESHIKIEADNVDVPFLVAGGSGIYSDGQVSAPNIVTDEMSTRVADSINFANAIKATGGFTPIHTYTWSITQDGYKWDYKLESLYETQEGSLGYTIFNGYLRIRVKEVGVSQDYAIIGEYNAFGGQMNELSGITFGGYPVTSITEGTDLELFSYNSTTNKATFTKYLTKETGQAKLYRHKITLNGFYVLMYNSTSNLNVGSVDDLRTIMKIKSESNEEILPVCASDATAMVTLVVTNSSCQVDGTDVTTVSDVVTAL